MRRILLIGALTTLGSLAIHMFVPAMPSAAIALDAPPSQLQLTLTLYLLGIAAGQVATGPITDRIGRRPVLVGGAALFVAGSVLCWAAPSIVLLLVGRVVQALGASSGLVAGRAMAGDGGAAKGARDMALLMAIVMLSPMLAPVLGSALVAIADWRAVFAVLAIAGAACGLLIWRLLAESFVPAPSRSTSLLADWRAILRDRTFLRNAVLGNAFSGGMYVFLSASPFLFVDTFRADPEHLGFFYGTVALGAAAGALCSSMLSARGASLVPAGGAIAGLAGLTLLLATALERHEVAALIAPMTFFAFGSGMVTPHTMMAAAGGSPTRVGTAVSLYGALQMSSNALLVLLVASFPPGRPMLPAILIASLAALVTILSRRAST
ncbi:Bcr/CflA family efflux MFS transporter [Roseiterribacter gracilis]|uniref:Bcr/CflA family efflux transporter n=1 Tax=Roseiterribacter gracilis TaxID=2812848 RepID=A0A8S8XK90_9PROT|nr:Bcr/CflA family drug resistance efflux transporter [Rhodospirillales bacterium TMPK1]